MLAITTNLGCSLWQIRSLICKLQSSSSKYRQPDITITLKSERAIVVKMMLCYYILLYVSMESDNIYSSSGSSSFYSEVTVSVLVLYCHLIRSAGGFHHFNGVSTWLKPAEKFSKFSKEHKVKQNNILILRFISAALTKATFSSLPSWHKVNPTVAETVEELNW